MAKFEFLIKGIIRAGDSAAAKMYLSELLTDMHIPLPLPEDMRPVEAFEISVNELDD